MKYIGLILGISIALYFLDKFCLLLEKKGLLYYRKHKPKSGGLAGSVLLEMQNIFNPSTQNVIEIKQNQEAKQTKNNLDNDDMK